MWLSILVLKSTLTHGEKHTKGSEWRTVLGMEWPTPLSNSNSSWHPNDHYFSSITEETADLDLVNSSHFNPIDRHSATHYLNPYSRLFENLSVYPIFQAPLTTPRLPSLPPLHHPPSPPPLPTPANLCNMKTPLSTPLHTQTSCQHIGRWGQRVGN